MNTLEHDITQILAYEEGFEEFPYLDTEKYPTVGYGIRIGSNHQHLAEFSHLPEMSEATARSWMQDVVTELVAEMAFYKEFDFIWKMCQARRAVMVCMAYQLGVRGLLGFINTLQLLRDKSYAGAAVEMLDSKWARQTAYRAGRMSKIIESGKLLPMYT